MSVTSHYLNTTANLDMVFQRIRRERKPRFITKRFFEFGNAGWLSRFFQIITFTYWPIAPQRAWVDLRIIPLLIDLGFIDKLHRPTPLYDLYRRDPSGTDPLY